MMTSNTSGTKLALRAAATGIVLGAIAIAGVAVWRAHHRAAPEAAAELAPDPAVLHYRYPTTKPVDATADEAATIVALEQRLKTTPTPFDYAELADLYLRKAQIDGDPADYKTAEAMARQSLAILPSPNGAVLTLAKLAAVRHDFRESIELARQHKKRTAATPIIIATAELALGELREAGEDARAAIDIKPDMGGYFMLALVMQAQGRDAEAAFDFAAAARHEEANDLQGSARLRALWGRFLLRRGELTGAAQAFEEALRIVPGFPLALAYRGELALRTGHATEAAKWFEQAFAGSRQVRYLIDQARALELSGDRTSADALRTQVESIVRGELGEGGLGHRLDLAEVLIDRGRVTDLAEAVALARSEVSRRGSFEARFQLARGLALTGARDEAIREVQTALASGAHEAQLYELAADLEAQRGDAAGAALYTRLADRLDPGSSGWRKIGITAGAK
jgi:tetratricopeptide (TPR) repeat protein